MITSPAIVAPAAPSALADVACRVEARIAEILDDDARRWTLVDVDLAQPLAALKAMILSSGKRIRPAFCYWSFVGLGGDPAAPEIIDAGAALELLHGFALIHDDVMDGSPFRRGIDTLHRAFSGHHAEQGWRGDGERFGTGIAILIGDLAFVYADQLISAAPPPARQVWNELRLEISAGQYLDLLTSARGWTGRDMPERIRQYKTAKYTVERPLHLGAALARPDDLHDLAGPLSAFGLPLGEAFQMRDDLLGVWGNPAVTGKPIGEDLRDGKPTLLAALARERVSGVSAALLEARFGARDLDDAEVAAMQEIFESSGARKQVTETLEALVTQALASVPFLPVTTEAAVALSELACFVAGRNH